MLRVTADLHLRLDVPQCRGETEEEWLALQRKSLHELMCEDTIVIAGDIFHRAVSSPKLVNMFINRMMGELVHIMAGNHDIQMRNPDTSGTSYGTLEHFFNPVHLLYDIVPYGEEEVKKRVEWLGYESPILFIHRLVFPSQDAIPPGSDGISARQLLKLYPDYKIIVAGDNHDGFIYEHEGRKVLVPGSMTIQSAKALDRKCYFYDINEETFEITKHLYPDTGEMVTRGHLDKVDERDERLTAFVEALKKGGEVSFDFEANVVTALDNEEIKEGTKQTVKEIMYE